MFVTHLSGREPHNGSVAIAGDEDSINKEIIFRCISDSIYVDLCNICHPVLPNYKPYKELCQILQSLLATEPILQKMIQLRVAFHTARQEANESTIDWFTRIKSLAADCKFDYRFESTLLDRFVSGLRSGEMILKAKAGNQLRDAMEVTTFEEPQTCITISGEKAKSTNDEAPAIKRRRIAFDKYYQQLEINK